MWPGYILFCISASFLLVGWNSHFRGDVLTMPLWMLSQIVQLMLSIMALLSWIAQIVVGVVLFGWLVGLTIWLPVLFVIGIVSTILGRNPAPPLVIGIVLMGISLFLLF